MHTNKLAPLLLILPIALTLLLLAASSQTVTAAEIITTSTDPTPLPDPLENPLPLTAVDPQSSWRAPLYPVPWALTEHDHFFFQRPVTVDNVNWPLPSYRYGGVFFAPDVPHTGVDIVVPEGTPVLAIGDGQVIWSGTGLLFGDNDEEDPYGIAVAIKHDFGWENKPLFSLYAHLSETKVEKGDYVKTGDLIALSGNTGFSTAPHLHLEIRMETNNYYQTYNPELWLAPSQGNGVVVGKLTDGAGEMLLKQEVILENQQTLEEFRGKTYGSIFTVNGDPFYQENFALSDIPAGLYKVRIPYFGYMYELLVRVQPGAVTYFRYRGLMGFSDFQPYNPRPENLPEGQ
ncbi:MAG: M23 family metallopeptidase [Anaerolineales bacterium]|nr:M23 family metallopeptidase [Anaerolineales bacterium]